MENILFKVKESNLERFFENKDQVSFEEIVNKLYEQDDEICYLQERYDDAVGKKNYEPDYDEIGKDIRMGLI